MQSAQYLPVELVCSTLKKKTQGGRLSCIMLTLRISQHIFQSGKGKLQVCKHRSIRMVTVQSVEGLMEYFLGEQKRKGLTFALINVNLCI